MPLINPSLPVDNTKASAASVDAALQAILTLINGQLDNSNLAAGAVVLNNLSTALQQALLPTGAIQIYGGTSAPSGWLLCFGQSLLRATYATLFAVIGTNYGSADGTHFNLPDMRGRIPTGLDNMGGSDASVVEKSILLTTTSGSPNATIPSTAGLFTGMFIYGPNVSAGTYIVSMNSGTNVVMSANATASASGVAHRFSEFSTDPHNLGAIAGDISWTLISDQMPSHTHSTSIPGLLSKPQGTGATTAASTDLFNQNSSPAGSDQAHGNMQPSMVVNFMIKT